MKKRGEKAFTLIEVVAVIGILCVLAAMMLPMAGRILDAEKVVRVKGELETIRQALEFYYYDNYDYPAEIYGLTSGYLAIADNDRSEHPEVLTDDFSLDGSNYSYTTMNNANCHGMDAFACSVGPNGSLDSEPTTFSCDGGMSLDSANWTINGDDIGITVYSQIIGTQHTRLKLDIIGAALCKYYWDPAYGTPNTMTAVADWSTTSTTRAALLLLHEFNKDGFGTGFKNTAAPATGNAYDTPTIYSLGFDETDDSGSDDDICF